MLKIRNNVVIKSYNLIKIIRKALLVRVSSFTVTITVKLNSFLGLKKPKLQYKIPQTFGILEYGI